MKTRYSKLKSTGRLLESQSGGDESNPQHLQDLIDNAVSSGHSKEDIEVGYEDDAVVQGWLAEQTESAKTYADKRREEYPSIEECIHAILDDELDALQIKRKLVKDKYPKE
jgi:hypothetical protein